MPINHIDSPWKSDEPCPDVVRSLGDVWMLLLWPVYVVSWGLVVGYVGARLSGTPPSQIRSVLASCAFANSTGLPITLLTVVHTNFPSTTELGRIDPTLFLSVYLLTYPMLQWSIGGWLLAPAETPEEENEQEESPAIASPTKTLLRKMSGALGRNVLNSKNMEHWYKMTRRGIGETDASLYISSADLEGLQYASFVEEESERALEGTGIPILPTTLDLPPPPGETSALLSESHRQSTRSLEFESVSFWDTLCNILTRVFQPPVIGAIAGIFVAATPLRGIFVDLVDRSSSAPLQWMFDALYAVGLAAVPLNMMILGINLSQSNLSSSPKTALLSSKTMATIVIGKMLVMPMIGVASVLICKNYLFNVPEGKLVVPERLFFLIPTPNSRLGVQTLTPRSISLC